MEKDVKMVKTTVRIPERLIKELKEAGKVHYRNFNSELIVAIEQCDLQDNLARFGALYFTRTQVRASALVLLFFSMFDR